MLKKSKIKKNEFRCSCCNDLYKETLSYPPYKDGYSRGYYHHWDETFQEHVMICLRCMDLILKHQEVHRKSISVEGFLNYIEDLSD